MKPQAFLVSTLVFLLLFSSSLPAEELAPPGTRERKFQRGLLNVAFAPVELTTELEKVKKKDSLIPTWITGGAAGVISMVIRAFTGIYEILTFPIPSPKNYEPAYKPEFALEHLGSLKDEA